MMLPRFAIGVAVISLGCRGNAEPDIAAVRQAIEQTDRQWEQAFNRGDAAGVASLYTENGSLLPPNAEIAQGREAIQQSIQGFIDAGLKNIAFTTVDVGTSGDLAYEIGRYSLDIQPPGSEQTVTDRGKYVIVARRQSDGSWKLVTDIFNTSQP
jgi:uncharacterized protein (TIGR02246 family)